MDSNFFNEALNELRDVFPLLRLRIDSDVRARWLPSAGMPTAPTKALKKIGDASRYDGYFSFVSFRFGTVEPRVNLSQRGYGGLSNDERSDWKSAHVLNSNDF